MKKTTVVKVEAKIMDGKYCRDGNDFCRFFWESEDGDYGCSLLGESIELSDEMIDTDLYPKFSDCPNPNK